MRKTFWLLLLCTFALSDENGPRQIKFTSEAPLEVVEGSAGRFSGTVTIDPDRADLGLSALIRVEVNAMQTGVALRDTHMRSAEWLDAQRYPTIQFSLDPRKTQVKSKGKDSWFVNAAGSISIKGRSQDVTIPLKLKRVRTKKGDTLEVSGRFNVKLSAHGIQGPAAMKMIGARVADDVRIDLKVVGLR